MKTRNRLRSIEVGIFSVVSLVFLNSVHHLFTDSNLIASKARRPLSNGPKGPKPANAPEAWRLPAAATPDFIPYQTRCQGAGESFETAAAKVRVSGPFCGATERAQSAPPLHDPVGGAGRIEEKLEKGTIPYQLVVSNQANRYSATVLNDYQNATFSTDFIPLEVGINTISMEFRYRTHGPHTVEIAIKKR